MRSTPFRSTLGCALRGSLGGIVGTPSNDGAGDDSFKSCAMVALPNLLLHKDLVRAGANGKIRFAIATAVARSHHTLNTSSPNARKEGRKIGEKATSLRTSTHAQPQDHHSLFSVSDGCYGQTVPVAHTSQATAA